MQFHQFQSFECHRFNVVTPSMLSHLQCCHTFYVVTPSMLSHLQCCHTFYVVTSSTLSNLQHCHIFNVVTPSMLSQCRFNSLSHHLLKLNFIARRNSCLNLSLQTPPTSLTWITWSRPSEVHFRESKQSPVDQQIIGNEFKLIIQIDYLNWLFHVRSTKFNLNFKWIAGQMINPVCVFGEVAMVANVTLHHRNITWVLRIKNIYPKQSIDMNE